MNGEMQTNYYVRSYYRVGDMEINILRASAERQVLLYMCGWEKANIIAYMV